MRYRSWMAKDSLRLVTFKKRGARRGAGKSFHLSKKTGMLRAFQMRSPFHLWRLKAARWRHRLLHPDSRARQPSELTR
jgi:hypothetical protein